MKNNVVNLVDYEHEKQFAKFCDLLDEWDESRDTNLLLDAKLVIEKVKEEK